MDLLIAEPRGGGRLAVQRLLVGLALAWGVLLVVLGATLPNHTMARRGWAVSRLGPAAVVGCALLAGACAGPPGQGAVTGTVRIYGGPALPGSGMALNGRPLPNSSVSLWSNGHQVASATTDAQGHFRLTLPAGTYDSVQACGASAPLSESVTVVEDQTTQHDITCPVP